MDPLVSVCIPAFNAEKYIAETINCLLNQTYRSIEIIVVEDNSTDGTWRILKSYNNEKIQIVKATGKGAAAARNQAFEKSNGSLIVFFDADDFISPTFISSQVKVLTGNVDAVVVSNWGRFYGPDISTFKPDPYFIPRDLTLREWIIAYWTNCRHNTPPGRIMINRHLIQKAGLWNEELSLNDDFDFFIRLFEQATIILNNEEHSLFYRSGIQGLSSKKKGYRSQLSNFKSLQSAINIALHKYPEDPLVHKACANMFQNFVFENYPYNQSLINQAMTQIKYLGGSDFKFPSAGITKIFLSIIGWKLTKRLKSILQIKS